MRSTTANYRCLKSISNEHHFGLLFCWRIRQGLSQKVSTPRIARYIKCFWEGNLSAHFNEEETLLLGDATDPLVQKTLQDHIAIRQQVEQILHDREANSAEKVGKLINDFNNHILFEEEVLFPHLQRTLSPEQFQKIEARLKVSNGTGLKNTFEDEFWRDPNSSL